MTDMVNHPSHYTAWPVEVIEITREQSFNVGNAVKYILRHPFKQSAKQDIEKAIWYLKDAYFSSDGAAGAPFSQRATADLAKILLADMAGDRLLAGRPTRALFLIAKGEYSPAAIVLDKYAETLA